MREIKIGVVGYGIRSNVLIGAFGAFDQITLAAIADPSAKARDKAAGDHPGAALFEDYRQMLDSGKVDAVLIESPPSTHADFVIEALIRDIHVLCDVPAVHEINEAQRLWDAGTKSKAVYSFGATTNFWGYVDTCADLKEKGLLGKPFYCEAEYVADLGDLPTVTPWRKHYEPIRYCTHSLGPILKWVDEDLAEVSCFDTGSQIHGDPGDHDAMVAIYRTPSGVVVKLLISFCNSHPAPFHRYVCHGTKGYFEKTHSLAGGETQVLFSTKEIYGMDALTRLPVTESRPELAGATGVGEHGGADYAMVKDFADAIAGVKAPTVGMREALRMTLPGLYALKSAQTGGAVTHIAYPWDKG